MGDEWLIDHSHGPQHLEFTTASVLLMLMSQDTIPGLGAAEAPRQGLESNSWHSEKKYLLVVTIDYRYKPTKIGRLLFV